jgi:mannose-6-phosphate isomerase
MENHQEELLGTARSLNGRFPLLIKILDAEEKLSLQVHPPAHKAEALRGEAKTEMWYITHARPGAELYVGLRPGTTRTQFEAGVKSGKVAECFHRVPVHSGDAMFLPSGRVHAIGAGLVIFEIQQNSDTTYRVFDWNRTDSAGKARQLHVAESLECIDFEDFEPSVIKPSGDRQALVSDPLFSVERLDLREGEAQEYALRAAQVIAVVEGSLWLEFDNVELGPGDFCLIPASLGKVRLEARKPTRLLLAVPG